MSGPASDWRRWTERRLASLKTTYAMPWTRWDPNPTPFSSLKIFKPQVLFGWLWTVWARISAGIVSRELKLELQMRKRASIPVSPELLTHFLVSAYTSVLTWWLNSRNPVSPEEIDAAYRRLVVPCLASIFG